MALGVNQRGLAETNSSQGQAVSKLLPYNEEVGSISQERR